MGLVILYSEQESYTATQRQPNLNNHTQYDREHMPRTWPRKGKTKSLTPPFSDRSVIHTNKHIHADRAQPDGKQIIYQARPPKLRKEKERKRERTRDAAL